jgi:hypothetical protein
MIRASVVRSETVTMSLPYGWELDTSSGEHQLAMPLNGAVSVYYALRDLLLSEGVELQ